MILPCVELADIKGRFWVYDLKNEVPAGSFAGYKARVVARREAFNVTSCVSSINILISYEDVDFRRNATLVKVSNQIGGTGCSF